MFLFAPTGNGLRLRSVPVATLLLVAANLVVAAWSLPRSSEARAARVPAGSMRVATAASVSRVPPLPLQAMRQAAVDARLVALAAADPIQTCGYRRGAPLWRAMTALFVHADWLHLGVNLAFLVLVGAFLEQAWGPLWTLLLYLGAGPLALFLDAQTGPQQVVLGASGAVAALLGAYCVRFWDRPVRCSYVYLEYLRPHLGSFRIPCPVIAGLWLAQQVTGIVLGRAGGDTGVAYVSHLGGFALGATVAAVTALARSGPARGPRLEAAELP